MKLPDEVVSITRETIEKFGVPGIAVLVARGDAEQDALFIGTDAAGAEVNASSLFNVASITKLATALCVLRMVEDRRLRPDDLITKFIPYAEAAQFDVTVSMLLCHTAGLPEDLPNGSELYGTAITVDDLLRECMRVPLEMPPRTRVIYSNVGYGLLALIVEQVTHGKFRNVLREQVLEPLKIEGFLGKEPARTPMKLADVRSRHVGTEREPYNSPYYRALGFPWSGLITTADGALKLVCAFAGYPANFLSEDLRAQAKRNQTDDLPGGSGAPFEYARAAWGLGADLKGEKKVHWTPPNASPRTFGHAGASGCVVWHDPDINVSWGIFGTRTADNGWLLRGGSRIAEGIIATLTPNPPASFDLPARRSG